MKSSSDSLERSVRFTRRTATVTMSAPEAACARAISGKLRYFPVPTISRDLNARPAMIRSSDIAMDISMVILDLLGPGHKSEERKSTWKERAPRIRNASFAELGHAGKD